MIMKTWNDYKEHVRTVDPEIGKDIDEVENISSIVSAMVEQRTSLGLSQRELAAMCGIPQSSVARIESCKTTSRSFTTVSDSWNLVSSSAILWSSASSSVKPFSSRRIKVCAMALRLCFFAQHS